MLEDFMYDQPIAYKIMINTSQKKRISHAYLIETKGYSRADELVLAFVKYMLKDEQIDNINELIDNGNYTELKIINPDGTWIKKEQLLELQKEFSNKSIVGSKKIYIINHAERLNTAASNSILKFLEEPMENIIAILVTENQYSLLDTIISRCQLISLRKNIVRKEESRNLKIASILFNNQKDIKAYALDEKFNEYIDSALAFVDYLEENGRDTLLYINNLWNKIFIKNSITSDLNLMEIGLEIVLLYYKDILNFKGHRNLEIFNLESEKIAKIASRNSIQKLCQKIQIVFDIKGKIKFNNNKNLLMDKFIILMTEGE